MPSIREVHRCIVLLAIALAASVFTGRSATAAEPLRWKFTEGEKLDYDMTIDMKMNMNAGPQGQMNMTMQQQMDMTWDVQSVNEAGDAVILQSIDRVRMKMDGMGQSFEYDSQAGDAPQGMAAMVAPLFDAMTKGKFEITMSRQGEVLDVKVPQEVVDALKNSPNAAMMGDMATADGFKQMLSQGALVLPEGELTRGQQWTSSVEMNNPAVGKQKVNTTYTYEGTKDIDGTTYDVFRPSVELTFAGQGAVQMNIKEQKSSGEILFDRAAGRLSSTTLNQDMTMAMNVGGQVLEQQMQQTVDVKVTPAN